ncbi:hypothetical protein D4R71_07005 [bacterium]|nr:MAG: hypothetical protein D4R71_07005 [bacterium]
MIREILIGNILDSQAQTLINTVNCVGIMGKGIALEYKKRYPKMYKDYKLKCDKSLVKLGQLDIFKELFGPQIINFPTKQHWRSISKISDIKKGLEYLISKIDEWGVKSLAIPPLGCGNGQLDWVFVGPLIYEYLNPLDIPVFMYAPIGTPKEQLTPEFLRNPENYNKYYKKQEKTTFNNLWLVFVEIVNNISSNEYHIPIGRTIFQKIGYLATIQGLPINLDYKEKSFGPFSYKLKKVATNLANDGIIIEERKGELFEITVGPNYTKYRNKHNDILQKYSDIIKNTTDLITRFNTAKQAEIVATIIFSYNKLKNSMNTASISEEDIFNNVMEWKKGRRPPLNESEVASAIRNLAILKWLKVNYNEKIPIADEFVY